MLINKCIKYLNFCGQTKLRIIKIIRILQIWDEGQHLEQPNVERTIFRNVKISNIKITKVELFDFFIFAFFSIF